MAKLTILTSKNSSLRKKSQKIVEVTKEIQQLILDMAETMKANKGIGLAAPQVGHNIRLIVISVEKGVMSIINPQITWKSLRKEIEDEGCLSCPNIIVAVKRAKIIHVKALNQKGQPISFKARGLFARVIQHEIDHLDGILIIDK